jgi:uncharacterized protein YaaN involved in tellurite resistance
MGVTSPGLDIDIDSAVGLKPEPPTPTTGALAQKADAVLAQGPTALVCKDLLNPDSLAKAKEYAQQQLPALIADPNQLAKLGNEAVEGVNALAGRMLHDAGRAANIPELTDITRELDDKIRSFTSKYATGDRSDQIKGAREAYQGMKDKVLTFFAKYRDMLHMLLKDAKGVEAYLDGLTAQIIDRQGQLSLNVETCNELLAENESAISKLTGVIAIMEVMRDQAQDAMDAIKVDAGDTSPDARQQRERKDTIATLIQQLDVRIGEFKQRLFVAWATSPQVRNIRTISYGLGQRLGLLVTLTIPVFKLTVVQWVAVMQADQASQLGEAVADANERALDAFAQASGEIMPRVAQALQEPSLSPEAILLIADSLSKQAKGFEDAYRYGIAQRAKVEAAIMKGAQAIAASQDQQAAAISDLIHGAQQPLELPPAPPIPDLITQNAPAALAAAKTPAALESGSVSG